MEICASCDSEEENISLINEALERNGLKDKINIGFYNAYNDKLRQTLKNELEERGVPPVSIKYPVLVGPEQVLMGSHEFELGLDGFLLAVANSAAMWQNSEDVGDTAIEEADQPGGENANFVVNRQTSGESDSALIEWDAAGANICAVKYFYAAYCLECEKTAKFLDSLPSEISVENRSEPVAIRIDRYDITIEENLLYLKKLYDYFGVTEIAQTVPVAFTKEKCFIGYDNIRRNLQEELTENYGGGVNDGGGAGGGASGGANDGGGAGGGVGGGANDSSGQGEFQALGGFISGILNRFSAGSIPTAAVTGFINGFNPCSLSMLLFAMALLAGQKRRIAPAGLLYILGKALAYFALGVLFVFTIFSLGRVLYAIRFGATIALSLAGFAIGVLNLLDYMACKEEKYGKVRVQLPVSLRRINNEFIQKITGMGDKRYFLPLMFLLGALISVGEFLCTGQLFMGVILYMYHNTAATEFSLFPAVAVYIVCMCIPLLAVVMLLAWQKNALAASELVRRNLPKIKLANAAVFFAIAAALLFSL